MVHSNAQAFAAGQARWDNAAPEELSDDLADLQRDIEHAQGLLLQALDVIHTHCNALAARSLMVEAAGWLVEG